MQKNIYLASTWFDDTPNTYNDQLKRLDLAKQALGDNETVNYIYAPNEHQSPIKPTFGEEWQKETFRMDVDNVHDCDVVVTLLDYNTNGSTDDGMAFEIGYAYAHNIPIVAVKIHHDGMMNLMIANSIVAFLDGFDELRNYNFNLLRAQQHMDKVF